MERICREQWIAAWQWERLLAYAHQRGVRLLGDLPIYVAPDSVAVWSERSQFQLDDNGQPLAVAGVPPDYFAADGQLWGNPLYNWKKAQRDGFAFWRRRMGAALARFDLVRIDHFRGLCGYWSVPAGAATAREGHWEPAPGRALLRALQKDFPDLPLVAEDLGVITEDVTALRHEFSLPGMRVLQFGFDGKGNNPHLPHEYGLDTVGYSGTHDNDTTLGWYRSLDEGTRGQVNFFLRTDWSSMPEALLRALLGSAAPLAIVPLQDILALGSEARFNVPGTTGGNWRWRVAPGSLNDGLAGHWQALNSLYGRLP
jgi:4-alpha-glucanotransferase